MFSKEVFFPPIYRFHVVGSGYVFLGSADYMQSEKAIPVPAHLYGNVSAQLSPIHQELGKLSVFFAISYL